MEDKLLSKKEKLIDLLQEMIKNIEDLPPIAMNTPINHYDLCSALILIKEILISEDK